MRKQDRQRVAATEWLLGFLAVISIGLLFLPEDWLVRKINIDLNAHSAGLYSDRDIGGNSEAALVSDQPSHWRCQLQPGFAHPFCSYQINLVGPDGNGMDLSRFKTLQLSLGYSGDGKSVRIYLRSRKPEYYVIGNAGTTKYNGIELSASDLNGEPYTVNLSDFSVADWWVTEHSIPPSLAHPDFNEVLFIEIQTGADLFGGQHNFSLSGLEFSGPIISKAQMYRGLVIVWVAVVFLCLLGRVIYLKLELKRHGIYQRKLMKINRMLDLENKHIEDLAKTDVLTGAANRLGIREALYDGVEAWRSQATPLSMILVDLDDFKKLNDTYGHDAGDAALVHLAKLMMSSVRSSDIVARWGGEEFMILCPNTDLGRARVVAENLRVKIQTEEHADLPSMSASFGVASLVSDNLDQFFKQADDALYRAKKAGKNRVVVARLEPVKELSTAD